MTEETTIRDAKRSDEEVVARIYVDSWNAGYGDLLGTRELERYAAERDCYYIMLITDTHRTEAQRFYEALGYGSREYKAFKKYLNNDQHQDAADG